MIHFNVILHTHQSILLAFSSHNIHFYISHARYMPNLPPALLLDNPNIIVYVEKYKSWISSSRAVLHSPVTSTVYSLQSTVYSFTSQTASASITLFIYVTKQRRSFAAVCLGQKKWQKNEVRSLGLHFSCRIKWVILTASHLSI